jgi:transposase-like protein
MKSPTEFGSLLELIKYFDTEIKCLEYLEEWKWKDGIFCERCQSKKIYRFADKKRFKCSLCGNLFTAKVGTIFENSNLPMIKWFTAIYLISSHKKGISSYQLAKDLKITQKTAWFMSHRVRKLLEQKDVIFEGEIQLDETFVGGKNKNRHKSKKVKNSQGRSFKDKTPVFGMVDEEGIVKTLVVPDTKAETIQPIVNKCIPKGTTVYTDEWLAYNGLSARYNHVIVDHSRGQYVNGVATTNRIEGVWSHLKRSLMGIYHWVSKKHLHRYVDESTLRYNTCKLGEGERIFLMMNNINCRLTYKDLINDPL